MANKNALQPEPITREFNAALVTAALTIAEWSNVDLHKPEQVKARIREYFTLCEEKGLRPSNLGLYAALGMSRQDVNDLFRRADRNKVSPACSDIIQKAKLALSAYREQLAICGKVSPPIAIFWAKNFDGMEDATRVELTPQRSGPAADMTPEEIAEIIERDIPIDADYEVDGG